ncbi:TetR family transcriptional regulator [Planotetraspora sp. A-T 1434]|uniref:TetR/AcrR family transcriptional regulator n=1 Tax=Planotetraspora sp. A-T 1434 TaxID=2979219 RepID=UPI0021C15EDA|nr:TetR/AcrR family transcriptional regulator [Planotetraspora sp. A-T 1434]MCT9930675.1 TetR family transcriptional regulator [Planotetraspora sp. A-T 1434]
MTRDREATCGRILTAARELFAEHGYDQVTMRMIASAADANVALVNRYFGSKAGLFAKVLVTGSTIESVIEGDPAGLPARLAGRVAERLRTGTPESLVRVIDRAGMSPEIRAVLRARVEEGLVDAISARLEGPRARERALLATVILLGVGSLRRLLGPESLRDADPAVLETRLEAAFRACLAPLPPANA